ncbi:hypothetical protein [Salinispora mooreana]|nr:hypothetical protein [Salinispora mooreana]
MGAEIALVQPGVVTSLENALLVGWCVLGGAADNVLGVEGRRPWTTPT